MKSATPDSTSASEPCQLSSSASPADVARSAIDDYVRLGDALVKLRALGMRPAIDDAGAGHSSFRHILELSPELIKLDVTLIRDIHRDDSKQALEAGLI